MSKMQGNIQRELVSWFHRNLSRGNSHCLYCGREVTEDSNKEHLIARNFVPKGSYGSDDFNFLFRACRCCNSSKADDERHVSSITLVNSPARSENQLADADAVRKAHGDFHPDKPGKKIADSCDERKVVLQQSPQMGISMGFTSPPQTNIDCVRRLALSHVQGLFSLVKTRDIRMPVLLTPGSFRFFKCFGFGDWGNPQLKELSEQVEGWHSPLDVMAADGFFRASLRHNDSNEWFWALEWNKYLRVVGALTQQDKPTPAPFKGLPKLKWRPLPCNGYRYRQEVPFADDYRLFLS